LYISIDFINFKRNLYLSLTIYIYYPYSYLKLSIFIFVFVSENISIYIRKIKTNTNMILATNRPYPIRLHLTTLACSSCIINILLFLPYAYNSTKIEWTFFLIRRDSIESATADKNKIINQVLICLYIFKMIQHDTSQLDRWLRWI
jgi:hypothetical protein